jgi:hypothetical protein
MQSAHASQHLEQPVQPRNSAHQESKRVTTAKTKNLINIRLSPIHQHHHHVNPSCWLRRSLSDVRVGHASISSTDGSLMGGALLRQQQWDCPGFGVTISVASNDQQYRLLADYGMPGRMIRKGESTRDRSSRPSGLLVRLPDLPSPIRHSCCWFRFVSSSDLSNWCEVGSEPSVWKFETHELADVLARANRLYRTLLLGQCINRK